MAMYTNVTRFTGLSGIDTESLVQTLMMAESQKLYALQRKNTLVEWRQDAYRATHASIKNFQYKFLNNGSANNIRFASNFKMSMASVYNGSNVISKGITATTSSKAVTGKYTIDTTQLAENATVKGDKYLSGSINGKTALDARDLKEGDSFKLTLDKTTKVISLTAADITRINAVSGNEDNEFVDVLNEKLVEAFGIIPDSDDPLSPNHNILYPLGTPLVEATLDVGGKLVIDTKEPGHTLTIATNTARDTTKTLGDASGAFFWDQFEGTVQTFNVQIGSDPAIQVSVDFSAYDGITKFLDTETAVKMINSAMSKAGVQVTFSADSSEIISVSASGNTTEPIIITDDAANGLLYELFNDGVTNTVTVEKSSVLAWLGDIPNGDTNIYDKNDTLDELWGVGGTGDIVFNASGNYDIVINGVTITLNKDDTIDEMMKKVNKSGADVTMAYDSLSGTFSMTANTSGALGKIEIDANAEVLFGTIMQMKDTSNALIADSVPVYGKDAIFELNGVLTSRSSNTFEYNGITFTLNEECVGDIFTIEIEQDNTTIKALVHDFVEGYNALIEEINGMVNERKAKTGSRGNYSYYDPLTADEKAEMTETEIANWEEKAKQGILSRDSILSGVTSSMRNWLYQSVELSDGTSLSLVKIGITTSSTVSDQGKLVIDEEKFEKALAEYGTNVAELFTKTATDTSSTSSKMKTAGLADRLNYICEDAVGRFGSITLKAGEEGGWNEFDNDLYKELSNYSTKISNMLTYLANRETYYYNMFSRMEAAVSKADSQMAYLQSMLGIA